LSLHIVHVVVTINAYLLSLPFTVELVKIIDTYI